MVLLAAASHLTYRPGKQVLLLGRVRARAQEQEAKLRKGQKRQLISGAHLSKMNLIRQPGGYEHAGPCVGSLAGQSARLLSVDAQSSSLFFHAAWTSVARCGSLLPSCHGARPHVSK